MVALDETALICDFAERYHVLDWRALPVRTAAALAAGLEADSRIAKRISGAAADVQTMLLAMITDALHVIAWQNTKDGVKGRNPPKSIVQAILANDRCSFTEGFRSVDEFNAWRASMTGGENNG